MRALLLVLVLPGAALAQGRAADGDEVVLRRLYPKAQSFELEASAGTILNPTFVDTHLFGATARYHWSEAWGVGLSLLTAQTKDRGERACIESFYNDPDQKAASPCASQDGGAAAASGDGVNLGPAYVPIREMRGMAIFAADYTIAYGKQIVLTGAVNTFDLRVRFGAGALASTVYDQRTTVRGSDRSSRGDPAKAGVSAKDSDASGTFYGPDGRPPPRDETAPVMLVGLQEEMYFLRRFFVSGELDWYTTTGIEGGVDPFFVAQIGMGLKL